MDILIITGMSGAGKSLALNTMEDLGLFCVDNLPPEMIPGFVEQLNIDGKITAAAFGADCRSGQPETLFAAIDRLSGQQHNVSVLFLDAPDEVLINRYGQTRRNHPLSRSGLVQEGIQAERRLLTKLRQRATYYINTASFKPAQLQNELEQLLATHALPFSVIVRSFGYKQGIPAEADLVLDVRFIPNPYWVEGLRKFSGLDEQVRQYVHSFEITRAFLDKTTELMVLLAPHYQQEGKRRLNLCIGCTGGRHRSVCMAQELAARLNERGINARVIHRDIEKDLQK